MHGPDCPRVYARLAATPESDLPERSPERDQAVIPDDLDLGSTLMYPATPERPADEAGK